MTSAPATLARPVRTEETEELPGTDLEIQSFQRDELTYAGSRNRRRRAHVRRTE